MGSNLDGNRLSWVIPIWIGVLGSVSTLIFHSLGPGFVVGLFKHNLQYNYKMVSTEVSGDRGEVRKLNMVCQIRNTGESPLSGIVVSARSYNPNIYSISVQPTTDLEEMPPTKSEAFFERTAKVKDELLSGQSTFVEFTLLLREDRPNPDVLVGQIQEGVELALRNLDLTFEVHSDETKGIHSETLGPSTETNYKPQVRKLIKAVGYVFIQIAIWIMVPLIAVLLVSGYVLRRLIGSLRRH